MNKQTTATAPSARSTISESPEMQARIERDVDRIMAAITDPIAAFQALTAGLHVEEWDTASLDENLRDKFVAFYLERKDGTRLLVVPVGQDPAVRLHAVRALLAHPGVTA
jgi:hypothetical protein